MIAWFRHGVLRSVPVWLVFVGVFAVLSAGLKLHAYLALKQALDVRDATAVQLQALKQDVELAVHQAGTAKAFPSKSNAKAITRQIQKQVLAHKVTLNALTVQGHPASTQALANTEWTVSLRGTYPSIKSTLAELLAVVPTLHIQSLKFSKTSVYEVEAQALLVEWIVPPTSGVVEP